MKLSPLLEPEVSIRCQGERGPNRDTHGEQFRLWISEAQFDLVYSWAVLEGIGSQVLVSARLGQVARKTLERITYLHTLKLSAGSALHLNGTDVVNLLADTNISYLAFVNQFFEFLPSRVGILSQRLVNDDLPLILIWFFLERNRPATQPSTLPHSLVSTALTCRSFQRSKYDVWRRDNDSSRLASISSSVWYKFHNCYGGAQ